MSSENLINVEFGIWAVQSCVNNESNSGDRTQPCGMPVFKILLLYVKLPALTVCLRHKRKFKIRSPMVTGNLRFISNL